MTQSLPEVKSTISVPGKNRVVPALTGGTPLIYLSGLSTEIAPVEIYAKAEWLNAGGSVKDRAALNIIRTALKEGSLSHDRTLLDASSGNTGIAYAMFAAACRFKVKLVIPGNAGLMLKKTLHAYGAEIVHSDPQLGSDGAIVMAREIHRENPGLYFYADQYNNPANWLAHYNTTGPEIIRQTDGCLTHFVAGLGTSGTFMGVGKRLRSYNPEIELIAVQPESPFHGMEGLKHMDTAIVPGFYDAGFPDRHLKVGTEAAQQMVKRLAREQGLIVGTSSGAAAEAALRLGRSLSAGCIVTVFPDSGYKYLDQAFWKEV